MCEPISNNRRHFHSAVSARVDACVFRQPGSDLRSGGAHPLYECQMDEVCPRLPQSPHTGSGDASGGRMEGAVRVGSGPVTDAS